MSRRAQLPNGDILDFPDNTPDAVMDKVVREQLAALTTPDKGTVTVDQAMKGFAALRTPDERSTGQVVQDSALNNLEGGPQFVAGVPGMVKDTGVMLSEALNPMAMKSKVNRGMQTAGAVKNTLAPLVNDAQTLRLEAEGSLMNRLMGRRGGETVPGTPSTPEEQRGYQNLAGQNMAALLVGEAAPAAVRFGMNPRASMIEALSAYTSPEARMMAATTARGNVTPMSSSLMRAGKALGNANPLDLVNALVEGGTNIARRGSIPINEALAKFMANGKPYGMNTRIPIYGGSDEAVGAARSAPSEDSMLLRDSLERQRQANLQKVTAESRMAPNQINQGIPSGAATADQAIIPQEKLGLKPPPSTLGLAVREYGSAAPPILDGPTVNKWMGTKPSTMMRGADPGARLVQEKLVGADKAATAANVKSALGSAGADLESDLAEADAKGASLNGKAVIDEAIADATKKFGVKSDEAFMKQIEQVSTDAASEFGDLEELNASRTHELKKRIGDSIDWKTTTTNPFNDMLKRIYRNLNDGLGDLNSNIRKTQLRWNDFFQADRALHESLVKDAAGRGTGADPLAAALKNRGKK